MFMSGKLLFLIGQTKIKDVHFVKKMTVKVRIIKSDIEMYISEKRRFKNLLSYPHRKNQSTKRVNSTTENFDFTPSEFKERIRNSNLSVF